MSLTEDHIFKKTAPETGLQRQAVMAVLAHASAEEIERRVTSHFPDVAIMELRSPEVGLVMLRGRIGGDGSPFNVGEATVTRAAIQLSSGETGFAYVFGRNAKKARLIAMCDALWQNQLFRQEVEIHVLAPLRRAQQQRLDLARAQTAATRVDFFTLARGEDDV
jgi:alpha-D-ribose 1-methylphosphonate 5-triphosphate synthase subunit PhnG